MLTNCTGDTKYMHESFDVNNPNNYTREWFAWANSMYALVVLDLYFEA